MTPAQTLKREQAKAARRALEDQLALHLRAHQVQHTREFTLPGRDFRWDFAFPDHKLLVEVHGGIWRAKGAHNTGGAITRDAEKGAYAAGLGWRTFAVTGGQITSGKAFEWINKAMEATCASN
jgi:very-short-patch-repair endonuclease